MTLIYIKEKRVTKRLMENKIYGNHEKSDYIYFCYLTPVLQNFTSNKDIPLLDILTVRPTDMRPVN